MQAACVEFACYVFDLSLTGSLKNQNKIEISVDHNHEVFEES